MENAKSGEMSAPKIWVVGESMMMDGIVASLEDLQAYTIARVKNLTDYSLDGVSSESPDLIIFEINERVAQSLIDILNERPHLYLLGLDLKSNQMIVMDCLHLSTRSIDDFHQLVQDLTSRKQKTIMSKEVSAL